MRATLIAAVLTAAALIPSQASAAYRHVKLTIPQAKQFLVLDDRRICDERTPGICIDLIPGNCQQIKRNIVQCRIATLTRDKIHDFWQVRTYVIRRFRDGTIHRVRLIQPIYFFDLDGNYTGQITIPPPPS